MFILRINVSFLDFQAFKTFSMLRNLSPKFYFSSSGVLYEKKKTPSAQIGSCALGSNPAHVFLGFNFTDA